MQIINLKLFLGDALRLNWPSNLTHIVANLPYQISSPVLEKIQQYHSTTPLKS